MHYIDSLINENISQEETVQRANELQDLFQKLMLIHAQCRLLMKEGESEDEEKVVDRVDRDIHSHRKRYDSWLSKQNQGLARQEQEQQKLHHDQEQIKRPDQVGSRSRKSESYKSSKSSKASSLMMKERARLAELKIEEEFMKQKKIKEEQLRQLQEENEKMNLQKEIAKTKARMQVYEENAYDVFESNVLKDIPIDNSYTADYVKNLNTEFKPDPLSTKDNGKASGDVETGVAQKEIAKLLQLTKAPTIDIDTFGGNLSEFPYFMTTFCSGSRR